MRQQLSGALVAFVLSLGLALPVFAAQEVCPNPQIQGGNDVVLAAGTEVCIKGANDIVYVTADGVSTLQVLLDARNENGQLQDVSHYSILEGTSETTTTTTLPQVTTTIETSSTTSTPEASSTTTTGGSSTTTTGTPVTTSIQELPFTGPSPTLVSLATLLLSSGAMLLLSTKKPRS